MTVRDATTADILAIIRVLRSMHAEAHVRVFDFSAAKLASFLQWLLEAPGGIALVAGDPIHGVCLGMVQEMWFGADKEAFNLPLYVLPEHRGGSSAVRLIEGYKKRASELGAHPDAINWVNNSGIAIDKTNRFIGKMGFIPLGGYFKAAH